MPDLGIGQQVDGDALLGRAAPHVEQRAVGPHQVDPLVVVEPAQRRLAAGLQGDAGVDRQLAGLGEVDVVLGEQLVDHLAGRPRARRSPTSAVSGASSLRYSSASSPAIDALSRSGRSLVTTTTSRPSCTRLRATARMRWSLLLAAQGARAGRRCPGG